MITFSSVIASALCAAGVSFDAASRSVTVEAESSGLDTGCDIEFLLVGPSSDNVYEAMFKTVASPAEIADAFEKAGIPVGKPVDTLGAAFWPAGKFLEISPSFSELVAERRGEPVPKILYTGGARDGSGIPLATANEPSAVFALYGCAQSLVQLDDNLDQSATYGRFRPAVAIPEGERRFITFTWKGGIDCAPLAMRFEPGRMAESLAAAREASSSNEVNVTVSFSPELTVREAAACAAALEVLDSPRVKINGSPKGEFFYRAFLPMDQWRDRARRLCQPPEVHLDDEGRISVVEIVEDWSGDMSVLEPKLSERAVTCATAAEAGEILTSLAAKTSAVLVFAPGSTKLAPLFDIRRNVRCEVMNWYVFTEK